MSLIGVELIRESYQGVTRLFYPTRPAERGAPSTLIFHTALLVLLLLLLPPPLPLPLPPLLQLL